MQVSSVVRTALLGPAYFEHRRLIAASKAWSALQTHEYQARKVTALFARYGEAIRSKADYRANLDHYTTFHLPGLTKKVTTGGTTATPLSFSMDTFARRQKERAYIFDIWADVGYKPFDLRVVYRGNIGKKLISYNWFENAYVISPAHLNSTNVEEVLELLARLKPFFLHVYPSSLLSLIGFIGESTMRSLPIRGILAGSEAFPPAQIRLVEEALCVRVAHWYGHAEYATLAKYCRYCDGFHFYPTYGYTEFPEGDEGLHRIVATSFNTLGTRFVRYDTGDLAKLSDFRCAQPFRRIDTVVGRVQEYFIGNDNIRYAFGPFLFGIHNRLWELTTNIQFIQRLPGEIDVRISFKSDVSNTDQEWARSFLQSRFSPVALVFKKDGLIVKTPVGKQSYYINELAAGK